MVQWIIAGVCMLLGLAAYVAVRVKENRENKPTDEPPPNVWWDYK